MSAEMDRILEARERAEAAVAEYHAVLEAELQRGRIVRYRRGGNEYRAPVIRVDKERGRITVEGRYGGMIAVRAEHVFDVLPITSGE